MTLASERDVNTNFELWILDIYIITVFRLTIQSNSKVQANMTKTATDTSQSELI